jgi:hypothetical protein
MSSIAEYNDKLINDMIDINLIDYFKEVHNTFYKNINITFMEYFLEICDKDDKFIIDHHKLKKYKIITSGRSNDIKECLNRLELVENIDFIVRNVPQQEDISRGIRIVKEYMLTPYAFKLCLIRSKNTKIYANYYLLLEKVFKYFNDYKIKYNKIILSIKDDELHKLTKKNKKKSKKIEELNEFIKETLIN